MSRPQRQPLPKPEQRWPLVLLALLLGACGSPAPQPVKPAVKQVGPVLAQDRDFVLMQAQQGDELGALAERYYGDARRAWQIAEFNQLGKLQPGQVIAIPLRPRNAIGVYPDGYQTVPVLCYHRFGTARGKLVVSPAAFEGQMAFLARNGYQVITMAQLQGFLQGSEGVPRKAVVLTIDDGYRSTYEIAYPILKKYGFPATVFLYSDFVGAADALTWSQMQEMQASGVIEIQPHSKTHGNLATRQPRESDSQYKERLRTEVDTPITVIRNRLAVNPQTYAFPYGDTNELVSDLLSRQAIRLGFTVTPGGNGFFAYRFMLRRTMVFGEDDIGDFKAKLAVFTSYNGRRGAE